MANITLKGNPIHTSGHLPTKGSKAPNFTLVKGDLTEVSLADYRGQRKVLNIFPSLDTGVCALSVKRFNKEATALPNTVVLNISADLPFAGQRFCGAEGLTNAQTLSTFRSTFLKDYGVEITDSPLRGLAARAVVVLDENDQVVYLEQVPEIAQEPHYEAAMAVLRT